MRRNENCYVDVYPDETSVRRLFPQDKLLWGLQRRLRSQHPHGGNMRRSQRRSIKALTLLIAVWTLTFWVYVYCFFLEKCPARQMSDALLSRAANRGGKLPWPIFYSFVNQPILLQYLK